MGVAVSLALFLHCVFSIETLRLIPEYLRLLLLVVAFRGKLLDCRKFHIASGAFLCGSNRCSNSGLCVLVIPLQFIAPYLDWFLIFGLGCFLRFLHY